MEQKAQSEAKSKGSPLPNGSSKNPPPILHRECLKNHAASLGGHALDGCCEFMPSSPSPLKCAACGCHRNFHRRLPFPSPSPQIEPEAAAAAAAAEDDEKPPSSFFASAPHTLLALSRDERPSSAAAAAAKKRFRTKFSAEQKGRMMELSERLGWRLQKRDEGLVEDYCREIGVRKGVFKVWMHNNKYHLFGAFRRAEGRGDVAGVGAAAAGDGRGVDGNLMNASSSSS